ncbi:MAG: histidine phosphatase family protein [Gemmatimonadota bacterium]|nr:histidine phosphatase family protein [Gemmatimonadota bacterium]MDE2870567.1 histidine phosphatase family protein [Gemmatimonadota bacterium]
MGSNRIRFITTRVAMLWPLALGAPGFSAASAAGGETLFSRTHGDPGPGPQEAVVVYLVRHAEKADDGTNDPPLAIAGQIRVQTLRVLLDDVDLTHVHTTDWKRTRDTARPFAEKAAVELAFYDPRELGTLAAEIRATPGRHLVAGHSNTTPQLVAALGGEPLDPIDELEYDRLYILVIQPGGTTVTTVLRFGEPYVEGRDFGLRAEPPPRRAPSGPQGARR